MLFVDKIPLLSDSIVCQFNDKLILLTTQSTTNYSEIVVAEVLFMLLNYFFCFFP
jgi:hypothetical protein